MIGIGGSGEKLGGPGGHIIPERCQGYHFMRYFVLWNSMSSRIEEWILFKDAHSVLKLLKMSHFKLTENVG